MRFLTFATRGAIQLSPVDGVRFHTPKRIDGNLRNTCKRGHLGLVLLFSSLVSIPLHTVEKPNSLSATVLTENS